MSIGATVALRAQQIAEEIRKDAAPTRAVILASRRVAICAPSNGVRTAEAAATGKLCGVYRKEGVRAERIREDILATLQAFGLGEDSSWMDIRTQLAGGVAA